MSLERCRLDVRNCLRSIRIRPGSAAAVVCVMSLGAAALATMFALADPYLFRALPYRAADRLVVLTPPPPDPDGGPTLADWQSHSDLFEDVATMSAAERVDVRGSADEVVSLHLSRASRSYFSVLGVADDLGPEWHTRDANTTPLVLTSEASRLLHDPRVGDRIAKAIGASGFRVVAVLPPTFLAPLPRGGDPPVGFLPAEAGPLTMVDRQAGQSVRTVVPTILARLRPTIKEESVRASLSGARTVGAASVQSLTDVLTNRSKPSSYAAVAAGLLILLVCASNVSNLLAVRWTARTAELRTRQALGASAADLARLAGLEILALACLGFVGAVGLTLIWIRACLIALPPELGSLGLPAVTGRTLVVAACSSLVMVIGGLLAIWFASTRVGLSGRTLVVSPFAAARAVRTGLAAVQTALTVVLLVGAFVLGHSFWNLVGQDPGYDSNVTAMTVVYPSAPPTGADIEIALDRLRGVPGVRSAAALQGALVDGLKGIGAGSRCSIDGRLVAAAVRQVSAGFFGVVGARLVAGRWPGRDEWAQVAVVTASLQQQCCAAGSAAGRTIVVGDRPLVIVGVVRDLYTSALDQPPGPSVFLSLDRPVVGWINYVLRLDAPDSATWSRLTRAVRDTAAGATVREPVTMQSRLMRTVRNRSFVTLAAILLAITATLVSAAGIAGVVGATVARRTREIAVHVALGATPADVRWYVVREATIAAVAGAAIGGLLCFWLSDLIRGWLYGVERVDVVALAGAAIVTAGAVLAASLLPAQRALNLSPTIALRRD